MKLNKVQIVIKVQQNFHKKERNEKCTLCFKPAKESKSTPEKEGR